MKRNLRYIISVILVFIFFLGNAQTFRIINGMPSNSKLVQSLLGCKGYLSYNKNNNTFNIDLYNSNGDKEISYVLASNATDKFEYIYRFGTEPFSKEAPGYIKIGNFKFDEHGIEKFNLTIYTIGNSDIYEFIFARRN